MPRVPGTSPRVVRSLDSIRRATREQKVRGTAYTGGDLSIRPVSRNELGTTPTLSPRAAPSPARSTAGGGPRQCSLSELGPVSSAVVGSGCGRGEAVGSVDARPYLFAVVLTGPPGAGKTSVLEALSDALTADDVGHAAVEVEALTSAHPPLDDEQWVMPVAAICGLYRRLGYDVLPV